MDFLNIFFKEETKIGLCAFENKTINKEEIRADFFNHFEINSFKTDFTKNILLIS